MDEQEEPVDWKLRAEIAEAALSRAKAEHGDRLIRAELKAEALKIGMIDLDGLKLLDLSEITVSDNGEVADAAKLILALKREKPWLFGGTKSSSAAASPPRPEPARIRHASELSHEDWLVARAALLRRR